MGSCVQMLIQMPLLFALYPVVYDIENYIPAIKDAPAEGKQIPDHPGSDDLTDADDLKQRILWSAGGSDHCNCNTDPGSFRCGAVYQYPSFTGYLRTAGGQG